MSTLYSATEASQSGRGGDNMENVEITRTNKHMRLEISKKLQKIFKTSNVMIWQGFFKNLTPGFAYRL